MLRLLRFRRIRRFGIRIRIRIGIGIHQDLLLNFESNLKFSKGWTSSYAGGAGGASGVFATIAAAKAAWEVPSCVFKAPSFTGSVPAATKAA